MFRTLRRKWLPNPLDFALRRNPQKILIGWNRGMGDLALGLYAIIHRIRQKIPNAEITFATRPGLVDAFQLLEGIQVREVPHLTRGMKPDLKALQAEYDLVLENPSPTDWCRWQLGKLTPKFKWRSEWSGLARKFNLPEGTNCIGVQVSAETTYGQWRNWPKEKWEELFSKLGDRPDTRIVLLGVRKDISFSGKGIIDLRGETTLFELVALIREHLSCVIAPDSGVLSLAYYLDDPFPLRVVSLWADPNHGILKQGVPSPNPLLEHRPVFGERRNLSALRVEEVLAAIDGVARSLTTCKQWNQVIPDHSREKIGVIILAGGDGSRLGHDGPKGTFVVRGKALFDHLLERAGNVPVAVMTSPNNHAATVAFLGGRAQTFTQKTLPLLDELGQERGEGPTGNGCVFQEFVRSGIWEKWRNLGIEYVSILPVDNPLANPVDPYMLGHLRATLSDGVVSCIEREGRPMGAIVKREGKLAIAEYMEWKETARFGSTGVMLFTMEFVKRVSQFPFPWHWVLKKGLWKREQFIFDAFRWAKTVEPLCFPREMCYAPIKGRDSVLEAERLVR